MRDLRYVGPDEDPDALVVVATDSGEQFRLPITPALRDATRTALPEAPTPAAPPEPAVTQLSALEPPSISPRDIQVRVRAGEAPETLAEEPGMTIDRVMRFAGPVIEERRRVASEAQRARARRNGSDSQTVMFGTVVEERFHAAGIDPVHVGWDSRRRHDGQWVVVGSWDEDGEQRLAEWLLNLAHRSITPLDETAADLLSDRPLRPLHPPTADTTGLAGVVQFPGGRSEPADEVFDQEAFDPESYETSGNNATSFDAGPTGTEAPVHRPHPVDQPPRAQNHPPAPRTTPTPAVPPTAPTTTRPAATHEEPHLPLDFTTTAPLPGHVEEPASLTNLGIARRDGATGDTPGNASGHTPGDVDADVDDPGRHRAGPLADPYAAGRPADQSTEPPVGYVAGEQSSGVGPAPEDEHPHGSRTKRGDKPKVPSWDDILLGVRRKSD